MSSWHNLGRAVAKIEKQRAARKKQIEKYITETAPGNLDGEEFLKYVWGLAIRSPAPASLNLCDALANFGQIGYKNCKLVHGIKEYRLAFSFENAIKLFYDVESDFKTLYSSEMLYLFEVLSGHLKN